MINKFTSTQDEGGMYESFSDLALCTLVITLVLTALLAVNITQRINVAINENQFNMDLTPLRSYIGVSQSATDNNSYVHFLDAEIIDKLIAYDDALTRSRIVNVPLSGLYRSKILFYFLLGYIWVPIKPDFQHLVHCQRIGMLMYRIPIQLVFY